MFISIINIQNFCDLSIFKFPQKPITMTTRTPNTPTSYDKHGKPLSSRFVPNEAFVERVTHALSHPLLLLYRSDPDFYVHGATGNVYVVNLTANLSCTCPDKVSPCKHILFVLVKVLGVSLDDSCLRRRVLKPSQLERLQSTPSSIDTLADPALREKFHQVLFLRKELGGEGIGATKLAPCVDVEKGSICPICLNEMGKSGDRLVSCGTCKIPIHEKCLMAWKMTQRRKLVRCVTCRSRLEDKADQERYLNLSAYFNKKDHKSSEKRGNEEIH
ncbi:hypothetical protein RND81_10G237000 [Saponaria officinalis]|uniref:Mitogen-activated protein kinase kinase kinase 1 n=1 Tax=Saponaria officinalis TaxID=3572 RepID=A0AAW1I741_SAPOF